MRVAQRWRITLPKAWRASYNIQPGDIFNIIDLGDGKLLFSPGRSQVDKLLDQLGRDLEADGETLEGRLAALRTRRESSAVLVSI